MHKFSTAARPGSSAPKAKQRGSTMIEVMIAILVLALGMMGMLGMFINSLKISSGAVYRNTASQHAYMMADLLRANVNNLQAYFAPTATATATCFTTGCAKTLMPNNEYAVWRTQLVNLLPAGQGVVCRDGGAAARSTNVMTAFLTCSNAGQVVVKVCWDESRIQTGNSSISNSDKSNFLAGGAQCVYTSL